MNRPAWPYGLLAALALAPAAHAQTQTQQQPERPSVTVIGVGEAKKPPEYVLFNFTARGEGATPVEALKAMNASRAAIEGGVRGLKGVDKLETRATTLNTQEVRDRKCDAGRPVYSQQPTLNSGDCAVIGVVVTLQETLRLAPPKRLGDVLSMAAQLGAKSATATGTGTDDDKPLVDEATAKAFADARRQAETIAKAAGLRLGPVLRAQNQQAAYSPIGMIGGARMPDQAPPPPLPVPQVLAAPVDLTTQPIVREARLIVTFALEP
ncbi:hypothetical protein C5708_10950 [Caulobacter sp. CCUG 60055]|nr:SIMPL domain-containing protein [Caulobacter sp. CCUG 60055]MBQ1543762.1 SIMPL domain-containing protein [Caulobacteraceae bacterium]MCI3180776.1 hypothetical protein [Caulobacter sp. CCUG 60055]